LAKSPLEASQALERGQRVLVLSTELTRGLLDDERDLEEFVDREGIRIVTLHHLTGDVNGGTAFLKGVWAWSAPYAMLESLRNPDFDGPARLNPNGLTEQGLALARQLMSRGVWIDLSHAPDRSYDVLLEEHRVMGKPLLFTHTALRRYLGAERGIADRQLRDVGKWGGFVGLMPSEDMLEGTPSTPCAGSVHALLTQWNETARWVGAGRVAIGSDFNGGIRHLKPSCRTQTALDVSGFWNASQVPALESLLPIPAEGNVREFLKLWAVAAVRKP
jgi:microsomal dipeptidase-like Zn-dependent dipeptidase